MNSKIAGVIVMVFALNCANGQGTRVVMPNRVDLNQTTFTFIPFGISRAGVESARFQQVYAAEGFDSSEPVLIDFIGFTDRRISGTEQPNLQFSLSTTPRGPDGLSSVFAENIGHDETVVFGPGPVRWPVIEPPGLTFDFVVPMVTPFLYDPAEGNLLLDVRNFEPESVYFRPIERHMDPVLAYDVPNDEVSRVFATSVDSLEGTTDSLGLVTLISYQPIPEPSTIALGLCGLVAVLLGRFVRKN